MPKPDELDALSTFARQHLQNVRQHYNSRCSGLSWTARGYRRWLAHYYNFLIPKNASVLEVGCGDGDLLARLHTRRVTGIDVSENQISAARRRLPYGTFYVQAAEEMELTGTFEYIVLSDTLSLAADIQRVLTNLHKVTASETRLLINCASSMWRPVYFLAAKLGLREQQVESSWLTPNDVENLLNLTSWESITTRARILIPCPLFGLDVVANRLLSPFLPWFCLCFFCVARPRQRDRGKPMRVSIAVPARNEAGTIEALITRLPCLGAGTEVIFVEGESTDLTWEEIQRVSVVYPDRSIKAVRQPGHGKGDAIRAALQIATGEIFIILDADLTVPPEELSKFYAAVASGHCEFANGVRLVYPTGKEMRFFNLCANKFFSVAFSWLLGQPVKDTLCGTKALNCTDYKRIVENRSYFGSFDPFGDFDLLFGSGRLNLKIADIPVRYQERTYGSTNIRRWRDGSLLLRMLCFAAWKLKFI
jgi:SAM-dependent methyltransferase